MGTNSVEYMIDQLSHKGKLCLVMKANEGYSCVLVDREMYFDHFLMEDHFNGPNVLHAIHQAWMEAEKE